MRKLFNNILEDKRMLLIGGVGILVIVLILIFTNNTRTNNLVNAYECEWYASEEAIDDDDELSEEEKNSISKELTQDFLENSQIVFHNSKDETKCKSSDDLSLSKKDADYEYKKYELAKVIAAEAGGVYSNACKQAAADAGITSDIWQQYVAYVFLNRVKSEKFPDTYEGVLKGGYAKETIEKFYDDFVTEEAIKNAEIALEKFESGNMPVSNNMVFQAEFSQGKTFIKVGNTYFGCMTD